MTEQTFSDPIAQGYYRQGERELSTTQSADEVLQKADAFARHDSQANLMHAACYYLAAAHFLETSDPAKSAPFHKRARGPNRPPELKWPAQRNRIFNMPPSVPTRERTIVSRRRAN